MHESDTETLQIDRDRLGQWAVENGMKINPDKSKAVSFTRAVVKDLLNQCFSQPPGRGPVPSPGINYTGPREVLLEFVILVV